MDYKKLKIFAEKYQDRNINPLYTSDSKDFEDGDCVMVIHSADYLKLMQYIKNH